MSAAPYAMPEAKDTTEVWASGRAGGALHLWVQDLRNIGRYQWTTPCGSGGYSTDRPKDERGDSNYLCGRCIQHQEREGAKQIRAENPCAGCDRVACPVCNVPTEARMLDWLHRYHTRGHSFGRYHFLTQVRSGPEPTARTADAVAMDTSQRAGFEIAGFEVKISRLNWQMEMQDPRKWEPVGSYCDRWWLALSDLDIVRGGEVPPQWGILLVFPTACHVIRPAARLDPKPLDRPFVASLLRAATRTGETA